MKAKAEKIGDRIWLRTSAPTPGLGQRIRGASFRKMDLCWTLPLRLDVCRMLRQEFPDLEIKDVLWDWAEAELAKEVHLTDLAAELTEVPLQRIPALYPAMAAALASRAYQTRATRFVATARSVLLGDTPGLGKTLEAISGILETGVEGPYLIVCPVGAMPVWWREIERWAPGQDAHIAQGSHARRAEIVENGTMFTNSWVIINQEMLRTITWWTCRQDHTELLASGWVPVTKKNAKQGTDYLVGERGEVSWRASDKPKSEIVTCGHESGKVKTEHVHQYPELFQQFDGKRTIPMTWGAVVIDESHNALIRLSGSPTQVRNGSRLLVTNPEGVRIACSGTPMRGRPYLLWGTLNWLRPKEHTGFWSWAQTYFEVESAGRFGGVTIGEVKPSMEALLDLALKGIMLRRTKQEVSPELPPKQMMGSPLDPRQPDSPIAVWLPLLPEQSRPYLEMQRSGTADVKGGQLNTVGALAELTRLKQLASACGKMTRKGKFKPALPSNKYEWLLQFLRELGICAEGGPITDSKVVVVSQFTSLMRTFAAGLMAEGVEVCGITGSVTGKRRQAVIDTFNAPGGPRVLFLQVKSGGVAITLDSADDMVFLDETHRPDDQEQAEDRINNRRPEEKVATRRYWYLRSENTVEEAIAALNASADKSQKKLLDGRRGVAYASAVFDYLEGKARAAD